MTTTTPNLSPGTGDLPLREQPIYEMGTSGRRTLCLPPRARPSDTERGRDSDNRVTLPSRLGQGVAAGAVTWLGDDTLAFPFATLPGPTPILGYPMLRLGLGEHAEVVGVFAPLVGSAYARRAGSAASSDDTTKGPLGEG